MDLSADGKWILFDETGIAGGSKGSVYIRGTDGSGAKRLGDGYALALSPDGKLAALKNASGAIVLWPLEGGEPRLVVTPDGRSYAYSFMRDLSQLFVVTGLR